MNAIVLMLDALGDADERAVKAAQSQGYPFYRFIEEPRPQKAKGMFERIKAIAESRNKSRKWIKRICPKSHSIALVDSDVVLPPNAVRMMLQSPQSIVGAWVPVRGAKDRWIAAEIKDGAFFNFKEPQKKITRTAMLPLAACVMLREIFDTTPVRAPDPEKDNPVICGRTGNKLIPSEPFLFTQDLNRRGCKCFMHPDVVCEHIENVY